ncbi:YbgF trimerization domain-containing protein [Teredinibacter purpureus]|jgi:tol-pal system protein YbgF|uniref:YbgF trimerization domain-containing protein n=1 Tax=Teredinibacter purpureus TaxID=2731756 RepID=UPI0005F7F5BC|nr:YbgF trimerization domain-containing protein [Teredinibacter purpureus]
MVLKNLLAAIFLMAAFCVSAQVEVIDRSPVSGEQTPPPPIVQPSSAQNAGELYYQLQLLQQEVLQLRGLVEQQTHEVKRLKQQRLDDYLDLDRRLSALGQGNAGTAVTEASQPAVSSSVTSTAPEDEIRHYRAAIDLVLKKQQYDQAVVALKEHLTVFPRGRYAANAIYWLGEIYLLKNDLESSRQWFAQLLAEYPAHRKAPDGKFKLGKVYHLMGDEAQAKTLLNEVAASSSDAARLAKRYLREHFNS